jgi:alkanesulfonate monooxygenase SsuD/methylene tetrahydromethanopterin reductase-like flavin-dependent oxidoreductase (luciferase family)
MEPTGSATAGRGLYLAPFDELAEPRVIMDLSAHAEARGWDAIFLWDRIHYPPGNRPVADVWVMLSAIAAATQSIRLGPMVTPLPRRRVQKVARETVTLDRLSRGRLTMGVGLGNVDDFEPFGDEVDPRERARLLDHGLERLTRYWDEEFQPPPLQHPRIPIWVAANWPHRRPIQRAVRWDGLFPIDLPGPDELAQLAEETRQERAGKEDPFDLIVEIAQSADPDPWVAAGATWVLTAFEPQPGEDEVRQVIDAGP